MPGQQGYFVNLALKMTQKVVDMSHMATAKVSEYGADQWQFRGRYPSGKQFRRVGFSTKKAADAEMRKLLQQVETHGVEPERLTVGMWLDEWLLAKGDHLRPGTLEAYAHDVATLKRLLGGIKLQQLDESHIRAAYRELVALGLASNTLQAYHMRLRSSLKAAVAERKLVRNPAANVAFPKGVAAKERKTWALAQAQQFIAVIADKDDAALWTMALTTGMRRGELCGLRWANVDLDAGSVYIDVQRMLTQQGGVIEGPVKTDGSQREIPLDPGLVSALRAWRARQGEARLRSRDWRGDDYVFTSKYGRPYNPASLQKRLQFLCRKADVTVLSPHELRHTFATLWVAAGKSIPVLSRILGHASVQTTMDLYVHPKAEQLRSEAAAVTGEMFG